MVTQWESEEAFQAWATGPAIEAHKRAAANPVATGASLLEFEVVLDVAGRRQGVARAGRDHAVAHCGRARRRPGLRLCDNARPCARWPTRPMACRIEINTPQGLRAKQTIDMLNSDWPIGTVGVRTMAAPQQVDGVTSAMGNLWLDRPITVAGIDIGAGSRDSARADVLRRRTGHRTAHQHRRTGRPFRGVAATDR